MRNATEETRRMASTAAGATADAARAGADLLQRNLEAAQQAWEASSRMASQMLELSVDQCARTTGVAGREARTATRQASHGFQESTAVLANGMQDVSREWLDLSMRTLQKSVNDFDALAKCRTVPEILVAQTKMFREHLDDFVQSTRRTAELLVRTGEHAARKTSETTTAS
jgi:hypothetical protein